MSAHLFYLNDIPNSPTSGARYYLRDSSQSRESGLSTDIYRRQLVTSDVFGICRRLVVRMRDVSNSTESAVSSSVLPLAAPSAHSGIAQQLESRIGRLRSIEADWNSYGAPAPAHETIEAARRAMLEALDLGVTPVAIVASAEGGTAVCFHRGARYAHLEFFNDGEILAMTSDGTEQTVWPVSEDPGSILDALVHIGAYIQG